MAVSLRNKVAAVGVVRDTTPTIVLPAGILGGECIRLNISWNNGGVTPLVAMTVQPAGFTQLGTTTVFGSISLNRYYKIAAGTVGSPSSDAGATVTATLDTGKAWGVSARVFIGSHPTNPIHAHDAATNGSVVATHAAPTLAVTVPGCWIEEGVVERGSSTSFTTPAGLTNAISAGPGAYGSPILIATADSGAAVATGTRGGEIWTGSATSSLVATWATAIAPAGTGAPTAAFSGGSTGGYTVNVDASGSNPVSPATLVSYDWDWGDGSAHGSGVTASHNYAAAGAGDYDITLTVVDSNSANDTETVTVTVTAPLAEVLPLSVLATGYVPSAGTELNVFTDTSEATYDTSPAGGGPKTYFYPEIEKPIAGQGLCLETLTDRLTSSTGSLTAKLYQDTAKTILISTISSVAVPDGTASGSHPDSSNTAPLVLNFPAADVAAMTNFSTPTVELTQTAS